MIIKKACTDISVQASGFYKNQYLLILIFLFLMRVCFFCDIPICLPHR